MGFEVRLPSAYLIEKAFLRALAGHLDRAFRGAAPAVRERFAFACRQLVAGTPEYASLLDGELLGELGIPNPEARVHEVIDALAAGVEVAVVPFLVAGTRVEGGMTVSVLRSDYQDLLSLPAASYVSAPSGSEVNWLDWLLTQGDRVVVYGYDVDFNLSAADRARSRTGRALMHAGSGWRVPPEFSGVAGRNFLTRAFDVPGVAALAARIFQEEITLRL